MGSAQGSGGVAFFAHIGGFVAGLILVRFFLPDTRGRDHDRWQGFRPSPRERARPRATTGPARAAPLGRG